MNEMTEGHTVKSYNADLQLLNQLALDMAALVRRQIGDAAQTLLDENPEAARAVVERDQDVDAIELKIDDLIIHTIAKRQPLAKDLRDILAVGKIATDLERIGDQARRIARLTLHFYDGDNSPPNYNLLSDIPKLTRQADSVLASAMAAFEQLDANAALEVIRVGNDLDEEMRSALRRLSTFLMEDSRSVGHVVDITLGLRAIERMVGHTKYIARHTIFLVKGKDVRHESLEQVIVDMAG